MARTRRNTPRNATMSSPPSRELSPRERVGTELEPHDLRSVLLAALQVEHRARRVGRPQGPALPARVRVVDATLHPLGEEADDVRHAQDDELAVHEGEEGVVHVAGGDRDVLAQA